MAMTFDIQMIKQSNGTYKVLSAMYKVGRGGDWKDFTSTQTINIGDTYLNLNCFNVIKDNDTAYSFNISLDGKGKCQSIQSAGWHTNKVSERHRGIVDFNKWVSPKDFTLKVNNKKVPMVVSIPEMN